MAGVVERGHPRWPVLNITHDFGTARIRRNESNGILTLRELAARIQRKWINGSDSFSYSVSPELFELLKNENCLPKLIHEGRINA